MVGPGVYGQSNGMGGGAGEVPGAAWSHTTQNVKPAVEEQKAVEMPFNGKTQGEVRPTARTSQVRSRDGPDPDPSDSSSSSSPDTSSDTDSSSTDSDSTAISAAEPLKVRRQGAAKAHKGRRSGKAHSACSNAAAGKWNGKLPDWANKLPVFMGDPAKDDLHFLDWIRNLEVQSQIFELPEKHERFVLTCLLDSAVTKDLQGVDSQCYATYADLKQCVTKLYNSRKESKYAHMTIFYSIKQGEAETTAKYLQRLMAELFKCKPKLKRNRPKDIKRRKVFLKDRFIGGLNKCYQDLLEICNLDMMKYISFAKLQRQAYQVDKQLELGAFRTYWFLQWNLCDAQRAG